MTDNKNDLAKILRQRRVMIPLTLRELSAMLGVSPTHLGRIERGERYPSARVLRKIAKPLGFGEGELFTLANYLSPQSDGQLDPYVAAVLSHEPVETQRALVTILSVMKSMAKG